MVGGEKQRRSREDEIDHLSVEAVDALTRAESLSRSLHGTVGFGLPHLLLAIAEGEGIGASCLRQAGVTAERIGSEIRRWWPESAPDAVEVPRVVRIATARWAALADRAGGQAAGVPGTVSSGHLLLADLELGQFDAVPIVERVCDVEVLGELLEARSTFHAELAQPMPDGFAPAKAAIARFKQLVEQARSSASSREIMPEIERVNDLIKTIVRTMAESPRPADPAHQNDTYRWFATRLHAELDQLEAHISRAG